MDKVVKKLPYTIGHFDARSLNGNERKKLLADYAFVDKRGVKWEVPAGYKTDGKSVGWAEIFVGDPFEGETEEAALIHDYYMDLAINEKLDPEERAKARSQKDTHRVFRELAIFDGCPRWKAWVMWLAVRARNRIKYPKWK